MSAVTDVTRPTAVDLVRHGRCLYTEGMTRSLRWLSVILLTCAIGLSTSLVAAKRGAPPEVPPVTSGNTRFEAPLEPNPCDPEQTGGCVVAYDNATGAQQWAVQVYCTKIDPNLERDVQDVFISSLALDANNQLQVSNEAGKHFTIDPVTQKVTGDARGCGSSGGCSFAPGSGSRGLVALLLGLGLLGLGRQRG